MGGKGKQTVGYHYLFTFIAGLGRGPIDELVEIEAGEKTAWKGNAGACGIGPYIINEPDLFGGDEKEGGIQGAFHLHLGAQDQILPPAETVVIPGTKGPVRQVTIPNVKEAMGGLVSEFRGFTSIIYDGLVTSMNPYIKEWKFRVRRFRSGWHNDVCWYPAKAAIWLADGQIGAMNPAHIIYQCLTDPNWGKGEPPEMIDEDSFIYAANLFCSEGLGLCIPWYRQEDVDDFIQVVVDHVGAVLYQDRQTGRYSIRVLRDDYDPETIPHFDMDSGLLKIEDDDSASSEAVNEVIVTGHDPITNQNIQVRAQSTAGWHANGGPISRPMEFKGLPTADLCLRKAQQELRLLSAGLKRFRLHLDRRAWQLTPASVIRISSAENNISNMVVRLGEITEGSTNGQRSIIVKCMEDVFALPATTFTAAAENDWTPPITDPVPAAADRLVEFGYRDLYLAIGASNLAEIKDTDAALGMVAATPGAGSYQYDLLSKADGEDAYSVKTAADYTISATLSTAIGPLDTSITLANISELGADSADQMLLLDNELIFLTAFDPATGIATVVRGCGDTIPASHSQDARLFSVDDDLVSDNREYQAGETVFGKCLPRTGSAVLDEIEATERTLDLIGRHALPYPPGDVKVGGSTIFGLTGEYNEPVLTWSHRDRIVQEDQAVGHTDPSIGPETGVTYTIRVYDDDAPGGGTLLRTETGITDATWTYDAAKQAADGDPSLVFVELEAERAGLVSWQKYRFRVIIRGGYGYSYGWNYGGQV